MYPKTAEQKSATMNPASLDPPANPFRFTSRSEFNSKPHLPFAPGKELQRLAQGRTGNILELFDCCGIRSVKQIEELNHGLNAHSFRDDKMPGEACIQVGIAWCREVVTANQKVHALSNAVSIYVRGHGCRVGEVKAALHPEDAADFEV